MMLAFALIALAVCAGALVALPFLRPRAASAPVDEANIYRDQLQELTRDEKAGELDAESASAVRTEIERRLIRAPRAPSPSAPSTQFDRVTAGAVAAIVVIGSVALYAATGAPITSSPSFSSAADTQQQALPDVDTMIASLRQRLEREPNDAEGWRMLGWSYFETQHYLEAVEAYQRAVALTPTAAAYQSALGEALTLSASGAVTSEARTAFQAALARDPRDERARFYLASAKAQVGDRAGGVNDWIAAIRDAAPDSPWSERARAEAQRVAQQAGIDLQGRLPPAPLIASASAPPIPVEAVNQAQGLPPQTQQDMINGMVEGLEARLRSNPRDEQGWVRLMRSRMVLAQPDRASAALASALTAYVDDRAAQTRLRSAAADLHVPGA